jgi:predicted Mrr-cat superfamily restriction endonuclease
LINYFSLLYLILSFIFHSNPSKAELKRKREEKEERELREIRIGKERKKREFWFELNGLDTEKELNIVFKHLGYDAELTPRSNDEGIDHVLDKNIVVQTKNQKNKVSRPDLQKFWGSWKDSHKKGIFVSIHGFAKTCKEFVKDKPILLYDVDDVVRMSEGKKPEWKDSSNKDSEGS